LFKSDNALIVPFLGFTAIGLLVALRRPGNALGWVFAGAAAWFSMLAVMEAYARYALVTHPGALPGGVYAAWLYEWWWMPMLVTLLTLPLLLFPDGHLPSPRWRPVLWGAAGLAALGWIPGALVPHLQEFDVANPFGIQGAQRPLETIFAAAFVPLALLAGASTAALVVRFRRAGPVERQQIKWMMLAGALLVAFVVAAVSLQSIIASLPDAVFGLVLSLVPLSAGVAIFRYRLYEIDVVINRAIVYGTMTAFLGAAYVTFVLVFQLVLRPLTEGSGLAMALSTLAVAALFRPARERVQALVDRRFYRRKYDAARTLESFAARLREEVDLDALRSELTAVVSQTMQPAHLSLWLREAGSSEGARRGGRP
jgi:hypothetical protein